MKGIWISSEELSRLPVEGAAWEDVKAAAYGGWSPPDFRNQDNHGTKGLLAGAMVAIRLADVELLARVRASVMAHIEAFDATPPFDNMVLSSARQCWALIVAADIAGLEPEDDAKFRAWLPGAMTRTIGNHGDWSSILGTAENSANNWGSLSLATYCAGMLYLGDTAGIDHAESLFRAYLGDRASYPAASRLGVNGYFKRSNPLTLACGGETGWTGLNPPGCAINGVDMGGAVTMDLVRSAYPPGSTSYSWDALNAVCALCEMLYRTGLDSYEWSDRAFKRALDFMQRNGWRMGNRGRWVPWVANARYGTSYPTSGAPMPPGYLANWTEWSHAIGAPPPPPPADPPTISSITPVEGPEGTTVTIDGSGFVDVQSVAFGGSNTDGYLLVNQSQIIASVPRVAGSGYVSIVAATGVAVSPGPFTVTTIVDPPTDPPGVPDPRVSQMLAALEEYAVASGEALADASLAAGVLREKVREIMSGS